MNYDKDRIGYGLYDKDTFQYSSWDMGVTIIPLVALCLGLSPRMRVM